jgi:hypothetical protein
MMFGYAQGGYLMVRMTSSPDIEYTDDGCQELPIQLPKKRKRQTTPARGMDGSDQEPGRAVAIAIVAHPLRIHPSIHNTEDSHKTPVARIMQL